MKRLPRNFSHDEIEFFCKIRIPPCRTCIRSCLPITENNPSADKSLFSSVVSSHFLMRKSNCGWCLCRRAEKSARFSSDSILRHFRGRKQTLKSSSSQLSLICFARSSGAFEVVQNGVLKRTLQVQIFQRFLDPNF